MHTPENILSQLESSKLFIEHKLNDPSITASDAAKLRKELEEIKYQISSQQLLLG